MELTLNLHRKILAKQVQSEEQKFFAELYHLFAHKVYNSVFRITNNYAVAEDIVQDAFCAAFEQRNDLREVEKFEGWVKRIAINKAISFLRKNKLVFIEYDKLNHLTHQNDNQEEEMLFQSRVKDIKAAIQSLPDGYRTIITLYLFEEIPQEEIGRMLNISHATVRSQYFRARKKILSILKERYHE